MSCSACGAIPARSSSRFCDSCGAPLDPGSTAATRKVVTVLFVDLVGSTSAQELLDPEAVRRWVDRYNAVLRHEIEAHGGRVVKFTGDGAMAVFGIPDVREDDALRALEAAAALHATVPVLAGGPGSPPQVALRIGVNTGEVVVSADDDDVVGDIVNVAARLQQAAGPGQSLVGEPTSRLVRGVAQLRPVPPLALKGKAEPVAAFLLVSLGLVEEGPGSPFVGRGDELARMVAALDAAERDRRAQLVAVVGSPGVGKTRLARELELEIGDRALTVDVRCEPGGGSTFAPVAGALRRTGFLPDDADDGAVLDLLRSTFDHDDPERDRVAALVGAVVGVGEPGAPGETFWAVRRLVERVAESAPLVVTFEDVHWAEPLLLDLIEHLADWTRGVAVVLVVTGRPEIRDLRPGLVEEHADRPLTLVSLEGLDVEDTGRLTHELLGSASVPEQLLDRVAAASEGNPLFVGELVRMLVDDGVVERRDAAWHLMVDLDRLDVPLTIHALLAARIDRLHPDERTVLEVASVAGKTCPSGMLAELVPADLVPRLPGILDGLRRKEVVDPEEERWLDEPVVQLHHALLRDAAYRRLLKETRSVLHERAARWLAIRVGDAGEHDDIIGFQLEQAHRLRVEMGEDDPALGRHAAARLGAAGRRALDANDHQVAASLLGRALECLPPGEHERPWLLVDRCEALLALRDAAAAAGPVHDLAEVGEGSPRLRAWAACFSGELANLRDPAALERTIRGTAAAASVLRELGDPTGEAKAHSVAATSLARLGRIAECEAALDRALEASRRAGDRRRSTSVLALAPTLALWGPHPVSLATGRCLDVVRALRLTSGSPAVEATAARCQAVLEALRGRDDAARRLIGTARRLLEELGHEHGLLEVDLAASTVAMLAGEVDEAERLLRRAHDGFHLLGVDVDAGLAAALLARVCIVRDRLDEALELTVESEKLTGDDLRAGITWRSVRAEALARRGKHERALALAREAVTMAEPTDALLGHADALLALAAVLAAAGDVEEAQQAARAAMGLYRQKEATVLVERARLLVGVAGADEGPIADRARDDRRGVTVVWGPGATGTWAVEVVRLGMEALLAADWRGLGERVAPDVVLDDFRPVVGGMRQWGRANVLDGFRAVHASGVQTVELRVLLTLGDHLFLADATFGTDAASVVALMSYEVDHVGRLVHNGSYEPHDAERAIAALEMRHRARREAGAPVPDNAATRFCRRWVPVLLAADWTALRSMFSDDIVGLDHRHVVGGDPIVGPDAVIEGNRGVLEVGVTSLGLIPLAVRGDRTVLMRAEYRGALGGLGVLQLIGVDHAGRMLRSEVFELDQVDLALARLAELAAEA